MVASSLPSNIQPVDHKTPFKFISRQSKIFGKLKTWLTSETINHLCEFLKFGLDLCCCCCFYFYYEVAQIKNRNCNIVGDGTCIILHTIRLAFFYLFCFLQLTINAVRVFFLWLHEPDSPLTLKSYITLWQWQNDKNNRFYFRFPHFPCMTCSPKGNKFCWQQLFFFFSAPPASHPA